MNLCSLVRTDSQEIGLSRFFGFPLVAGRYIKAKLMVSVFLLAGLLTPSTGYAQNNRLFAVQSIIRDVKTQLKLTTEDLRQVGPLIEQENMDVLLIYARFDDDEPEYSPALWQDIIDRRTVFESRLRPSLTHRQKAALRIARAALERRILGILVDDYIFYLSDTLELSDLQVEGLDYLLRIDSRKKHRLIIYHHADPAFLQAEVKKVDEETESKIRNILSPVQLRLYHSLRLANFDLIS